VEPGAGRGACFPDASYASAGATLTTRNHVLAQCDILAVVQCPDDELIGGLRPGQTLIGLVDPITNAASMSALATARVTTVAFEMLPRTLSRAQAMDALSSQSSAAGYRAAILAAEVFGRYLSMMITASGTATPAKVIVIGTGVDGLQAIATARRLGAVVTGFPASLMSTIAELGAFLAREGAAARTHGVDLRGPSVAASPVVASNGSTP
jgi:NAD(P) transhydrogenase subunit alpha